MTFKYQLFILIFYGGLKILYTLLLPHPEDLSIKFLDVGQGDAVLIRTYNNTSILIDGGPSYDIESYIGSSLLNYCRLDIALLSHDHQDHSFGLKRLLEHCNVANYVTSLYAGDVYAVDDVHFYVLWPPYGFEDTSNENNNSIVLLLDYGDFEAIFTGDAEAVVFSKLKIPLGIINGDIDLLKVPHHGAINGLNKEFLERNHILNAIISVGAKNKFKHPSLDVIKFYEVLGTRIYRTDIEGSLEIRLPKL